MVIIPKPKSPVILIILGIVFVCILLFFGIKVFVSEKPVVQIDEQPPITPLTLTPAQSETELVNEKYYTVSATYPASILEIKAYVDTAKAELESIVPKTEADAELERLGGERKYSMIINTKVFTSSSTISYVVENYSYTGGAHGIADIVTFVYDSKGNLVSLKDILKDGNSLGALSEKSRTYFYSKIGNASSESVIDQGTAPIETNWQRFYLTEDAVVFIFGQYSLGPYTLGIQEFVVSYSDAQSFLSLPSR
jgi:hypothetical protein